MTTKLFGTDGMRGPVKSPMLAPENVCQLGRVIGSLVKKGSHQKNAVTMGRDTRGSGTYLEAALSAGIMSMGVDCQLVGVLPSSGIAYATKLSHSAFGIVISASHNPACDNGIKLFGPHGFKIEEETENLIEQELMNYHPSLAIAERPGRVFNNDDAESSYLASLASTISPSISLQTKRIVIDCAHGAASKIAPHLFSQIGCDIRIIGASPDGLNINRGFGSEYPGKLKSEVVNSKADLGIAFDGDADRVIFIDENGELLDGDAILAIFALHLKQQGLLDKDTLVSTVMSSIALDLALNPHGIKVERTPVGDKFVARHLVNQGFSFGGENSGHLIMLPNTCTGDGLFFALQFLNILGSSSVPVSKMSQLYQPTPKILKNIEVAKKIPLSDLPNTEKALEEANTYLKNIGRVMLRYSGTENKLRILVEAPTQSECQQIADNIALEFNREVLAKN